MKISVSCYKLFKEVKQAQIYVKNWLNELQREIGFFHGEKAIESPSERISSLSTDKNYFSEL